jgi:hypothetical protein
MVRELLSEWFSLDGRLFKTFGALARPGRLTRRYLDGECAAYLRPFRLYMLASLILFSSVLTLRAPDASEVDLYLAGELVTAAPAARERPDVTIFEPDSAFSRWLTARSAERIERLRELPPQALVDRVFSALRRALPAALVLFLPFLALALKLLYIRTGTLYVDHLTFAVHFQSALFVSLALVWLLLRLLGIGGGLRLLIYFAVALLLLVVYLPLALHRVYRQARWLTAIKTLVLVVCYAQLLGLSIGPAVLVALLYL